MRSRHSPPESLLFAEFCKKFPVLRRMSRGDRFVSDCAHHHPVLANRAFPAQRQIGRFCGDFRPLISRIFVSVSAHPFWWRYLGACLRNQKFRSRRPGLGPKSGRTSSRNSAFHPFLPFRLSTNATGRSFSFTGSFALFRSAALVEVAAEPI